MTETWPDPAVPYVYPARTPINERRWQQAIAKARAAGSLELIAKSGSDEFFELTGVCPRCGHTISQSIEFCVFAALPAPNRSGEFNISCNCRKAHAGRDDKHLGCGWGGSIPVTLTVE